MLSMVMLRGNFKTFLKKYFFLGLIILMVIFYFLHVSGAWQELFKTKKPLSRQNLLDGTNQVRDDYGLASLKINIELNKAAELKAQDMFEHQYWDHVSPQGVQPWHWFKQVGYQYNDAGENLAKNFSNTDDTVLAWMNSIGHRENVLYEGYRDVGFAIKEGQLNGKKSLIVVALYGSISDDLNREGIFLHSSEKTQPDGWLDRLRNISRSMTLFVVVGLIILLSITSIVLETKKGFQQTTSGKGKAYYLSKGFLQVFITLLFVGALVWFYRSGQIM